LLFVVGRTRNGEADYPSTDVGCSGATGAPNVPLASVLGNNRVTFATLQLVTYQLHFHALIREFYRTELQ
jgi:hypothetical protein